MICVCSTIMMKSCVRLEKDLRAKSRLVLPAPRLWMTGHLSGQENDDPVGKKRKDRAYYFGGRTRIILGAAQL